MTNTTEKKVEEQAQAPAATPAEQQAQANSNFDLTVQDLQALKTIVDVAAQRGVFKPNEMEAVGKIYNKLAGFLEQVAKGGQNA